LGREILEGIYESQKQGKKCIFIKKNGTNSKTNKERAK